MTVSEVDERGYTGREGLRVQDTLELGAKGFMEIAGVLARFHDLAETIKTAKDTDE
jgi:hypothetical protein